jgi:hypothetical protein
MPSLLLLVEITFLLVLMMVLLFQPITEQIGPKQASLIMESDLLFLLDLIFLQAQVVGYFYLPMTEQTGHK